MATKSGHGVKRISLSFYKKTKCWYAEVPGHTEGQNQMVAGADTMCEMMADGHKRVTVKAVGHEGGQIYTNAILSLEKVDSSPYGATYNIYAKDGIRAPKQCWLCNVTKTVFKGNHPRYIEVLSIEPNDKPPYNGKLPW